MAMPPSSSVGSNQIRTSGHMCTPVGHHPLNFAGNLWSAPDPVYNDLNVERIRERISTGLDNCQCYRFISRITTIAYCGYVEARNTYQTFHTDSTPHGS